MNQQVTDTAIMELQAVTLSDPHVRLVPMEAAHGDCLRAAVTDGELWRLWNASVPKSEMMDIEIARRIALHAAGSMLPFTVVDGQGGDVIGMTSFMNVDRALRRVEIGGTWYAQRVQRTALNTSAKFLLLEHAFQALGCVAVELRTHALNQASRRAIVRLGAHLDGVLRAHRRTRDGSLGDSAVYSIIAPEWPAIRLHLRWQIDRPR